MRAITRSFARKQRYANPETLKAVAEDDAKNKLRRNNITPVLSGVELLMDALERDHASGPFAQTMQSLSHQLPDMESIAGKEYDSMSFEEKRVLAERIDVIAESIIKAIEKV